MSLKVTFAGPLATIQDLGRYGYAKDGFSISGAMDNQSAIMANRLVGNIDESAVLEMTLCGMKGIFTESTRICVCGGDFSVQINGKEIGEGVAVDVACQDEISIGFAKNGCRVYLAVYGGFSVPMVMGSRSTNLKCKIGGYNGRKIAVGDILPIEKNLPNKRIKENKNNLGNNAKEEVTSLRVISGPQDFLFSQEAENLFYSSDYIVGNQSDRMGIRTEGNAIHAEKGNGILSDGIVPGCIQIPDDGHPIILGPDCQTTGGYAKIATCIRADLYKLGQLRPGDKIRFIQCFIEQANSFFKAEQKIFNKKYKKISKRRKNG